MAEVSLPPSLGRGSRTGVAGAAISVVYPEGPALHRLLEAVPAKVVPLERVGLGLASPVALVHAGHVASAVQASPSTLAVLALVENPQEVDPALDAGAVDALFWPGSTKLLQTRVRAWSSGSVGPGRLIMNPSRTTSLAHAVRNPRNVITLYAELLRLEPLSADALGSLGRMVRAAKRVDALVGELETLLYLEAKKATLRLQPTELNSLLEAVVAEHAYDIEDKSLTVQLDCAADGLLAWADPDLARRALHAVFGRVVKLCLTGVRLTASVRVVEGKPSVEIVAPIQVLASKEQTLFRCAGTELDARESLGGVGVGLSFAHEVLSQMKGEVSHQASVEGQAVTTLHFASPPV